ncbi:hypothetical protein SAMN05421755_10357 [Nitrosomonas sp. Nm33]|nr:hypothetical protein SAMN05421755_10357 [Nitrosomonas sp. Nm33]
MLDVLRFELRRERTIFLLRFLPNLYGHPAQFPGFALIRWNIMRLTNSWLLFSFIYIVRV